MVPSVYSQSARYRLVEQKYTSNNQTRTHIRIQFCFVQVIKPALFRAVPNNIIQITLFTALLNLPNYIIFEVF